MQEYYTANEVAQLLRVHPNSVYRWIRGGKLERVKLASGGVRIPAQALLDFLGERGLPGEVFNEDMLSVAKEYAAKAK